VFYLSSRSIPFQIGIEGIVIMSSNVFEDFLARNKPELILQLTKQVQKVVPDLSDEEAPQSTSQIVDFILDRMLGKIKVEDQRAQAAMSRTIARGTSREAIIETRLVFFSICRDLCASDPQLDPQQREHVERMLNQSQKFSLTDIAIIKTQNLKSQQ
jgi:hypothetical protein